MQVLLYIFCPYFVLLELGGDSFVPSSAAAVSMMDWRDILLRFNDKQIIQSILRYFEINYRDIYSDEDIYPSCQ